MTSVPVQESEPGPRSGFAALLTRAITARQLTLERIADRLHRAGTPVSVAALSYWKTGRSVPTRASSRLALRNLEVILQVPAGTLLAALEAGPAPRQHCAMPPPEVFGTLQAARLSIQEIREIRLVHTSFEIGDAGRRVVQLARTVYETRSRRSQRLGMLLHAGGHVADVRVTGLLGGELDEVRTVHLADPLPLSYVVVAFEVPGRRVSPAHLLACRAEWTWRDEPFGSCGSFAPVTVRASALEVDNHTDIPVAFSTPHSEPQVAAQPAMQHHVTGAPAGLYAIVRPGS